MTYDYFLNLSSFIITHSIISNKNKTSNERTIFNLLNFYSLITMIEIDDKIISDDILEEQFVCDLSQCKGSMLC